MLFPVSGVETPLWVPPLTALAVSFVTSMGGVSGAFLLLPFQVSVLGYTAPSVSATNQVFNIVAIPGGVYRYLREGRMVWPLVIAVTAGTLPGVFLGALVRVAWLPDPTAFKAFAGLVLLYIGARMARDAARGGGGRKAPSGPMAVTGARLDWRGGEYVFEGERHTFSTPAVFGLCLAVGVVGGVYGIGGGAIVAPFFVAVLGLPVHTVAGAALCGTFVTSVFGVLFYHLIAPFFPGMAVAPDWRLGLLFGLGGLVGIYLGARCQRFVPARLIKLLLTAVILFTAGKYLLGFLFN
ncbi:sulfite exporter TauE/SafE family protein [Desulfohalovibrio reitneri]|uniref:sulfite exporter TauE/SafE family protein n=1 Tax=Desulfohalovibrio reitneri TaxID=1307759 RepID=UPI0004A771EE|nr:sulfite exporter TauE/SafE family protein [Desulfohalovibrio reitneri]